MKDFTSCTSDQHIDSRESRTCRDNAVVEKLFAFFKVHNPFPETSNIMSIASSVVSEDSVNCHKALEVGVNSLKSIFGQNTISLFQGVIS